jgi:hypothetical protein
MEYLKNAAVAFAKRHPGAVVGQMDTFRHDSWQMLMERPSLAVKAAIFLRTALKLESDAKIKYDTRICIGIGPVELITEKRISNSRGVAFTRSGKCLDTMDKERFLLAAGDDAPDLLESLAGASIPLLDCIISNWSPTESRAVYGALRGWTQEETAKNWPLHQKSGKRLTRQAVGDSLMRAHWRTVEAVLFWIEKNLNRILPSVPS